MFKIIYLFSLLFLLGQHSAIAQGVPSTADSSRIDSFKSNFENPIKNAERLSLISDTPLIKAPEGSENISFTIKEIKLQGVSDQFISSINNIYQSDLGTEISLDKVWLYSAQITKMYRDAGYFLSRTYVPAQQIEDGSIEIHVIEGYVDEVIIDKNLSASSIISNMIADLRQKKPLNIKEIESFLLRLNDLPGTQVKAIMKLIENSKRENAIQLVLQSQETKGEGSLNYSNSGSRFLGPHQVSASYETSLIPRQQTKSLIVSSIPFDEMQQISLSHKIPISSSVSFEIEGSLVRSEPGHTLRVNDIESKSDSLSMSIKWQIIKQRLENFDISFKVTSKNSESDILGSELSHDKIRTASANIYYDFADKHNGYNIANLNITQGINGLGSSDKGDLNLSRAEAEPNFTKAELTYTRFQEINPNWQLLTSVTGQIASGPLYSSQEFGFGGPTYGRAYDPSEITGDRGIASLAELRYRGIGTKNNTRITPYAFYDIGKVWNDDDGQEKKISASSAGMGIRLSHDTGLKANLAIAQPITKSIAEPIYGNGKNPRVQFDMSYNF